MVISAGVAAWIAASGPVAADPASPLGSASTSLAAGARALPAEPAGAGKTARQRGLSPAQVREVQQIARAASAIVDRLTPEAQARGLGSAWRKAMLEQLLALPPDALEQVALAEGLDAAQQAARELADAKASTTARNLVYNSIVPCRFIDTRFMALGKIPSNTVSEPNGRGFDLAVAGGTYGGTAACDPMTIFGIGDAQFGAVVMNVTVVDPDGAPGFAAVVPDTAAPVTSLLNWYEAGPTVQVANQAILTVDQTNALQEFWIRTSSRVHVIVDIFGAFTASGAVPATALTALACSDTAKVSTALAPGSAVAVTSPACAVGQVNTGGSCAGGMASITASVSDGAAWSCTFLNQTGAAQSVSASARCCSIQ